MNTQRNRNLFGQTRWQIITLLRKGDRDVKELSAELGITENAIRPHLAILQRDGLVQQIGIKQSGGKPAHVFELTSEAEHLFPKAYGVLLSAIIDEIRTDKNDQEFDDLMAATAKKLSGRWPEATGNALDKLKAGVEVLNDMGGLAEISNEEKGDFIQGYSCPLSDISKDDPRICYLAQMLLQEITGLSFEHHCSYGDKPKCRFKALSN